MCFSTSQGLGGRHDLRRWADQPEMLGQDCCIKCGNSLLKCFGSATKGPDNSTAVLSFSQEASDGKCKKTVRKM